MNTTLYDNVKYIDERTKFFKETICTVGTKEGSIVDGIIDIYVHEITLEDGEVLYTYKPVCSEIEVNGTVEHIVSIYLPRLTGSNPLMGDSKWNSV